MAIALLTEVVQSALWPQGDIRDPLGVWGFRQGITGDATGGGLKVSAFVPQDRAQAYLYTCYSAIFVQLTGVNTTMELKSRLLTNWPDIDSVAGIQGYATWLSVISDADDDYTAPRLGPSRPMINPLDRFILLFDPRQRADDMNILELEAGINTNAATYSAEGYGYFWDRSVLNAPGGPRHPGSS